jgi:hypothetical protein
MKIEEVGGENKMHFAPKKLGSNCPTPGLNGRRCFAPKNLGHNCPNPGRNGRKCGRKD